MISCRLTITLAAIYFSFAKDSTFCLLKPDLLAPAIEGLLVDGSDT